MSEPTVHPETLPASHLASTRYEPAGGASATLLALPGVGVRQDLFDAFGRWQAARGVRVVSIDWTGVGRSPLPRGAGRSTTLTSWARQDAVAALRWVKARFGGPVGVVGHSFGGQALAVADELQEVDAIVLVASQTPYWRFYGLKLVPIFFGSYPVLGPWMEEVPGWAGVGTTLPGGVVTEWSRWGRTRGTYLTCVDGAKARLARVKAPILAYSFPDDPLATPAAVRDLLQHLPSERLEHRIVTAEDVGVRRIGHIRFFRDEAFAPHWAAIGEHLVRHGSLRQAG